MGKSSEYMRKYRARMLHGLSSLGELEPTSEAAFDKFSEKYLENGEIQVPDDEKARLSGERLNTNGYQLYVDQFGDYGKPEVVADKDFSRYAKENGLEIIYRGVVGTDGISADQMHDSFMYGDKYYVGNGIYGDGMYFSNMRETAKRYAGSGDYSSASIIRAALKPGAKSVDYETIRKEFVGKYGGQSMPDSSALSAYARSRGYDAIVQTFSRGETYTCLLNRGAMVVSSKKTPVRSK